MFFSYLRFTQCVKCPWASNPLSPSSTPHKKKVDIPLSLGGEMHIKFAFTETIRPELSWELWLIWKCIFTPLSWSSIHKRIFIAFSHIHNSLINYFQHFRGVCATLQPLALALAVALASCSRSFAEIRDSRSTPIHIHSHFANSLAPGIG